MEEFKNCLPSAVTTFLSERQVNTVREAAVLADEYALTHCMSFRDKQSEHSQSVRNVVYIRRHEKDVYDWIKKCAFNWCK